MLIKHCGASVQTSWPFQLYRFTVAVPPKEGGNYLHFIGACLWLNINSPEYFNDGWTEYSRGNKIAPIWSSLTKGTLYHREILLFVFSSDVFSLCLNCWKNHAELQKPQAVLFDKLALWRTISALLIKVSCDFWAPDQKSADSSHGWLWCPYGQCTASDAKETLAACYDASFAKSFLGSFVAPVGGVHPGSELLKASLFIKAGSFSGKCRVGAAGRLPVTGWHQEVKLNPVSTAIHWWSLGAPCIFMDLSQRIQHKTRSDACSLEMRPCYEQP